MLIKQKDTNLISNLQDGYSWAKVLIEQIRSRFNYPAGTKDGFPCIFAQKTFAMENVNFLLIKSEGNEYSYCDLAVGLHSFLRANKEWDGNISTVEPLLVIFEPSKYLSTIKDFEGIFINSLQYLINNDAVEWSGSIPTKPDQEFWTMCFAGVQLFINVSHPCHDKRRSRNLCDGLVLVINPRERFDKVAGNNEKGALIREKIKDNILIYDLIPPSPLLGYYQDGDLEWPQYMLPVDNDTEPLKCPLRFNVKECKTS